MTNIVAAIVGIVMVCCAGPTLRAGSVQTDRLDPRIGRANPELYRSVVDAKDWKNPYLVIGPDSIYLTAKSVPADGKAVAIADLRRSLIELPVTAWPYGRVVGLQESGIRGPDRVDDNVIADNLRAALSILKTLGVTVNRWP